MKEYIKPEVEILKWDIIENIADIDDPSMNIGEDGEIIPTPWKS